jgi:hypothetical protein
MKRVGYEEAKQLIAAGWQLFGKETPCYLGGTTTYARLISPNATDGYYRADELVSITWACFKKLGGC